MIYPNEKPIAILVILWICFSWNALAQQDFQVETITTNDGLSQGMINDILQDREGFLWIATKDGLNRYDGYDFKVFTNDPNDPWSISGNTIELLFEDSKGRIWAASDNAGLNIYDKETGHFHHINYNPKNPGGLTGHNVSAIVEDSLGFFVVGIDDKELNMFRLDDNLSNHQLSPAVIRIPMPSQKNKQTAVHTLLKGMVKDAEGRIWVGVKDAVYQLDVQRAALTLSIEGYSIGTVFANPDGSIWACGNNQSLFHWDGKKASTYFKSFIEGRDIRVDQQKNLWFLQIDFLFGIDISTWKPGDIISSAQDHCFFQWQPKTPSGNFIFSSMTIDRSGIIWVGTLGHGLLKVNPKHLKFAHFLPGVSVRQISITNTDKLFIKNYNLEWYNEAGFFLLHDPLQDGNTFKRTIDYLFTSKSGEYWIRQPYYDGDYIFKLKRYNPVTKEVRFYEINSYHHNSQPIIESRDNDIWMAGFDDILTHLDVSTDDLISYDLKTGKQIQINSEKERLWSEDYSTALYEDQNGILWVGTERGFTKVIRPTDQNPALQISKYQNISNDLSSLSYNHVSCFLDDPYQPDRFLWVCTKGGGLNRLDKKTGAFIHLTKKDGLPDDVIYGLLSDEKGNLWGSTNKGLFCMSQNKETTKGNQPAYTFRNFSKADGLQENEFNTDAYAKLPDGRLAFGGVNGYNVFDPKAVLSDDFIPPVFITNILVNNQAILQNDESDILESTIETSKKITLTHEQRILTLEFSSLDFNAPDRNKYRYQLVGADDTWVEAGNRRSATFLNLQANDYTFRVQGSNSQGIWSDHIAELQISILPPWWKTGWAYLIYATLFVSAIWTYFRFSINRAKLQQQLTFEKQEADRVRELDALKTQLFTNMTHEFRTPLTIIIGMAQQVMDKPAEHFKGGMNLILKNGKNLLGLVNQMLSLSKLESGKMTLDLVQADVVLFLRNIVESFRSFATKKEIQLHFLPEVEQVMMDFDQDKIQQVVSNLISNAFKFTPHGGHIYFSIRQKNDNIIIRVKDTGRGIPLMDQDKIFDRFYQADNSSTRAYEGTGIGLALSKNLITLMKGKIAVQSPPTGARMGTEFSVTLPIKREALILKPLPLEPINNFSKDSIENGSNGNVTSQTVETFAPLREKQLPHFEESKNPLILLVEDNADVVAYVASCLGGYRLAVAENGQEGFEMAAEMIPDLIISDVMMPIMDGFELCQKVKLDERTDHVPVIMLTARADMDSKIEGLELGANAYLPKPFDKQELLLSIKNLFELRNKLRRYYQSVAGLAVAHKHDSTIPEAKKIEDAFVIKVREVIETHIDDFNFTVEQLAKELHLSHSQFGRKLDALTGFTPNRFIRNIRLKKAMELLLDKELSITAVAYDCGFNDPSYFTRVFKKEFGKTPVEWRVEVK